MELARLPALEQLAADGLKADSLQHIFPTKTFATHYATVTGLYAENSGVVANNMWDPTRRTRFSLGNRNAVSDGYWYDGEPIWNTVEKAGKIAATYFWPGSEAQIGGIRPTYWKPYAGETSHEARVDQVLAWLDLPKSERPQFLTLYFSAVDSAGHAH
ncbi:MAG: alkaline phosphatase family protein, partial [Gammaproteobacteria bacterium]|nr:alkaline phosphatase family protein [Gammaproteobacteria bacterium]